MKKIVLILFLITIIVGCGKSSQDSSTSSSTPQETTKPRNCQQNETFIDVKPNQSITESSCPYQTNNIVTLNFASDTNNIYIGLQTSSLYLFSYTFYLAYDATVLEFIEYQRGNFDAMSGNDTVLEIKDQSPTQGAAASVFTECDVESGKRVLIFGHTRNGFSNGSLPGNITLGTLRFRKLSPSIAQTDFAFKEVRTFEKYSNASLSETSICWPKNIRLSLN